MDKAAEQTRKYYDEVGWQVTGGKTIDRWLWVDDRACADDYESLYYARIRSQLPQSGGRVLDVGCGPLEDLHYRVLLKSFKDVHCVDLSVRAIAEARRRMPGGKFYEGDFLDLPFEANSFDCVLSSHSLYHVHANLQEAMVRKMISVVKPGAPVIVAYKHGGSVLDVVPAFRTFFEKIGGELTIGATPGDLAPYAHTNEITWWNRFSDVAVGNIRPLHTFDAAEQRVLFPDDYRGKAGLSMLADLEDKYPGFFTAFGKYALVVLRKK